MELPEYHLPQAKNVGALLWEKLKHYAIKAGTIILACTIVIWFLSNFGWNFQILRCGAQRVRACMKSRYRFPVTARPMPCAKSSG